MDFHFYLNQFGGVAGIKAFLASFLKTLLAFAIAYLVHRLTAVHTQEAAALALLLRSLFSGLLEYGKVANPSFDGTVPVTGELA